jgi:hypothetical protein
MEVLMGIASLALLAFVSVACELTALSGYGREDSLPAPRIALFRRGNEQADSKEG